MQVCGYKFYLIPIAVSSYVFENAILGNIEQSKVVFEQVIGIISQLNDSTYAVTIYHLPREGVVL